MNKFLKLILSFLFLIGLIKVNDIFCAAKITENSSSSSSSSVFAKASSDASSLSSVAPTCVSHGKIMSSLSSRQKKVAQEFSKLEEFKHFPPGIIPLIMQYDYNDDATKELLKALADRNLTDDQALIDVRQALDKGANPNNPIDPNTYLDSPLEFAIRRFAISRKNFEIVKILIEKGANVNATTISKAVYLTENGPTALKSLINPLFDLANKIKNIVIMPNESDKNEFIQTLKLILEKGVNPNITDPYNGTTLMIVTQSYYLIPEVITLLLDFKADPYLGDYKGTTFIQLINEMSAWTEGFRYPEAKKAYEDYLQEKSKKETSSSSNSSAFAEASADTSSSSQAFKARVAEPFNYPGSPAPAPTDDKVPLTTPQLRFLWDNVTPEQRKAWEDAGGLDIDPRTIKEIGKATVRIILG